MTPRFIAMSMFAAAVHCAVALDARAAWLDQQHGDCPFSAAQFAPADVNVYVHIADASALRRELSDRPIGRWLTSAVAGGRAGDAWTRLAAAVEHDPARLFDSCFGKRVTFLLRRDGHGEAHWVLITEMDRDVSTRLLARLKARLLGPAPGNRQGAANRSLWEIPEHDLLIASATSGTTLLIGPRSHPALFRELLAMPQPMQERQLAAVAAIKKGRDVADGGACIGFYTRHDAPLGGWSVAAATLDGEQLVIRHFAHFENSPFSRPVTAIDFDPAPLDALAEHSLVAVIEPTDIGRSPFETFLVARLGESIMSGPMQRNLSDRRILVLGEVEGRSEREAVDLHAPTLAVCIEMREAKDAEQQLDRQMKLVARRLEHLGQGRFQIDVPEDLAMRSIDISAASEWLTGGMPLAKPVSLNWAVAPSTAPGASSWYVIATHPKQLDETLRALRRVGEERPERVTVSQSCGVMNGPRISHHLRSWAARPDAGVGGGAGEAAGELRETLLLVSELAGGLEQARWNLRRPSRNEMCLEVRIKLSPPESTRP